MQRVIRFLLSADPEGSVVTGWRAWGYVILRVWLGYAIMHHGWSVLSADGGIERFAGFLGNMGVPAPGLSAWAAKLTEFLGGILLALGLLTRPAAFGLSVTLAVAVLTAHGADPLFGGPGEPSKELAMLYLVPFVVFFITGPGQYAFDTYLQPFIFREKEAST